MLPLRPQRVAQSTILLFLPAKSKFCRKKSATKFLCVKTSSGRVVATSFPYLTVDRWIVGDVPIYLKFALKVTHPFRKRRCRQISHNSAAAVRASEKVNLSLTRSRQCAFRRIIDESCALPVWWWQMFYNLLCNIYKQLTIRGKRKCQSTPIRHSLPFNQVLSNPVKHVSRSNFCVFRF